MLKAFSPTRLPLNRVRYDVILRVNKKNILTIELKPSTERTRWFLSNATINHGKLIDYALV